MKRSMATGCDEEICWPERMDYEVYSEKKTVFAKALEDVENANRKRATTHPVWKFFHHEEGGYSCPACHGKKFLGIGAMNASNALKHLRALHPSVHAKVLKEVKEMEPGKAKHPNSKWKPSVSKQRRRGFQGSADAAKEGLKSARSPKKHSDCSSALLRLIALPTTSITTFLTPEFVNYSKSLDANFELPTSRMALATTLSEPAKLMKKAFGERVRKCAAGGASCTVDIWIEKSANLSAPCTSNCEKAYLAATCHYVHDTKLASSLVGIKVLSAPITSDSIKGAFEAILLEGDLAECDIHKVVAGTAPAMVAVYQRECEILQGKGMGSARIGLGYVDEREGDEEIDDVEEVSETISERLKVKFPKMVTCAAHDLQLVLHSVIRKKWRFGAAIAKLRCLTEHFRGSPAASERLYQQCGFTISPLISITCNSLAIILEQYVKVAAAVEKVVDESGWSEVRLNQEEHQTLLHLSSVLLPFKNALDLLQGEQYVSLSQVYPTVRRLQHTLNKIKQLQDGRLKCEIVELTGDLIKETQRRFTKVTECNDPSFDITYVTATLLDPNVAWMLEEKWLDVIKGALLSMCHCLTVAEVDVEVKCEPSPNCDEQSEEAQRPEIAMDDFEMQLWAKKKRSISGSGRRLRRTIEDEIDAYIERVFYDPVTSKVDTIGYWLAYTKCDALRTVALRVLSIPASAAPIEHIFSTTGIISEGGTKKCDEELLENKLYLYFNDHLNDVP